MKLVTTAGLLKAALNAVSRAVESRVTIPVLSMVKFDGRSVEASNLDLWIRADLPATVARGALCLPFRPLAGLVAHVGPDETVTITGGTADRPGAARVSFGTSSYDLPAIDAADFPTADPPEAETMRVDGDAFRRALGFVMPSISTEETRYYLNGVYLDDTLAVATDGHRLAAHPTGFSVGEARGILPHPAVKALMALPPPTGLAIEPARNRFAVTMPGICLSGKLIDGNYPDWRRVVPRFENDFTALEVDRAGLRAILSRLSVLDGSARMVTIGWQDDMLAAVVAGVDAGVFGRERMAIAPATMGGAGRFSVNLRYFLAALRLIAREDVEIRMQDRGAPLLLRGEGEAFMIVMPMRGDDRTDAAVSTVLTDAARARLVAVPERAA